MTGCILGIDFGTTLGWALWDPACGLTSGFVSFKVGRFEGGGMRFLRFQRWLEEIMSLKKIDTVYFEEVRRHKGVDAAHVYGGFLAHLSSLCEARQIPYQGIPVGVIKKAVCKKGNANKDEMVEAISQIVPAVRDHNEADAIGVLVSVLAFDQLLPVGS